MLLFIAAIKNVPVSYYEAASLDGAGPWRQFSSITLPSIAPTSFIVILLNTINAMKEYPLFVVPQQRRTRHLEQPARPVHLRDRLQTGPDRLRERRVVRAHAHPDGRRDHPAVRQPAGGEPMTTTDTPRPVDAGPGAGRLQEAARQRTASGGLRRAVPATTLLWVLAVACTGCRCCGSSSAPSSRPASCSRIPLTLVPHDPTLSGYKAAWDSFNFSQYFLNTLSCA